MKKSTLALLLLIGLATFACRTGRKNHLRPAVDPEFVGLTKQQILQRADNFFDAKKWVRARRYYSHLYESYPNDAIGRRSLLHVADTYYGQGGSVNLIEAQYKYHDYINRYPGSSMADYATFQIAMVSFRQMDRPDRDQSKTKETVRKLQEMLNQFPNSRYRGEAEARLADAKNRLAKHELLVATFYERRGAYKAAVGRLNGLVDDYPNFSERDEVFYELGICLKKLGRKGEARLYFERVLTEFPSSEYASRAKKVLADLKA